MAQFVWQETWDGVDFEWVATWTEGSAFEISAPPALTFMVSLGIAGEFAYTLRKDIAGAAVAGAQAAGTLQQTGPMGVQAVASAQASGDLSVGVLLGGGATARAQAAATLLAVQAIAGDAFASAYGAGDLTLGAPEPAVPVGRWRRRVGRDTAAAATGRRIGRSTA